MDSQVENGFISDDADNKFLKRPTIISDDEISLKNGTRWLHY